jgi:hypothetical protein
MSNKELNAAIKGHDKLLKRHDELAGELLSVATQRDDLEKNMGQAVFDGKDPEKLAGEFERLTTKAGALTLALELADRQLSGAAERIAEVRTQAGAAQAVANLKEVRRHMVTIDGLAGKLDAEREALARLVNETTRLPGQGMNSSKVMVMRNAWQSLEDFNEAWPRVKRADARYDQQWTDAR